MVGWSSSLIWTSRHNFCGKERDSESGLDYFLARYYSGAQGRFTSPDPKMISKQRMLDPQQWNMYEYARNNPLLFIDPDGAEIGYYYAPGGAMYSPYDPQFPKSAHPIRDTLILGAMTAGALLGPEGAAVARGLATSLLGWALGNPEKIQRAAENVADMVSPPGSPSLTSMAESFGFKSFREAGSMIGGELKGGGTALLSFSKSSETFGVNVSMVAGPAGTLSRLETGAIDAARAQGASILELKASMVKDSVGRLLRMNGFTQIMKDGKATGDWIKKINLLPQ
jgi:RHS repeat-associated protein